MIVGGGSLHCGSRSRGEHRGTMRYRLLRSTTKHKTALRALLRTWTQRETTLRAGIAGHVGRSRNRSSGGSHTGHHGLQHGLLQIVDLLRHRRFLGHRRIVHSIGVQRGVAFAAFGFSRLVRPTTILASHRVLMFCFYRKNPRNR